MEELERVFIKTIKSGKYTGTLEWYKKEGILIDNCFRSVVKDETGEIIKIIDKKRPIPEKIRPDIIVPPPMEGAKHLYYFTPGYLSSTYVFTPPLKKPVVAWVVRAETGTFIYDAETGEKIGEEVPPPSAFCTSTLYKPWGFGTKEYDAWANYRKNAVGWLRKIGLSVEEFIITPGMDMSEEMANLEVIREKLKNNNIKYFYIAVHTWRWPNKPVAYDTIGLQFTHNAGLSASRIRECFKDREPARLAFLASCHAMDQDGRGPLSEAFRKGKMKNTVTIGYKNMTDAGGNAAQGWQFTYDWQDDLFRNVYEGKTWKDAFYLACALYPKIVNNVVFCGDTTMRLVPTTAPEPPKKKMAYLKIGSSPSGAEIWLKKYTTPPTEFYDTEKVTPSTIEIEPAEIYDVMFRIPGYKDFVLSNQILSEGGTKSLGPTLAPVTLPPTTPKKSVITFKSEPTGAELRLTKH